MSTTPAEETLQTMFADGTCMTVAQGGPVAAGLRLAVDPRRPDGAGPADRQDAVGRATTSRARCRLFGDARHIYLVELNNDNTASTTRAFRAEDGASVPVPNFASLYQKKQRIVGREMLRGRQPVHAG